LKAMQANGLKLIEDGKEHIVRPRVVEDSREAGPQDYVFLSVKAHALVNIADAVQPLLGPNTALVPAINGLPWWYFYKIGNSYEGTKVEAVDPGGVLWDKLPPSRVIGCIVYPATDVVEPGVIKHEYGNRFDLGEPDGSKSDRAQTLSKLMIKAGMRAPVRTAIRDNLWVKLWGNLSFNMLCTLTTGSLDQIIAYDGTKALARRMMLEGQAAAEKLGVRFPIDVDARIQGAAEVGVHKPSTLIDLERGRPMEIDPLLGAVVEIGRLTNTPMPNCEAVLPIVRLRAKLAGLYST
jgi:2-dehydropantoate 2-reductase